jgi:hypothetical protein
MICDVLDKLDRKFIDLRAKQRQAGMTEEQRRDLEQQEIRMTSEIAEHKAAGHDGQPCPGD